MSHDVHRWKIIKDFVTHFNDYLTRIFSTSYLICADESISRWYRQGFHWKFLGFPMYVAMDMNPEN